METRSVHHQRPNYYLLYSIAVRGINARYISVQSTAIVPGVRSMKTWCTKFQTRHPLFFKSNYDINTIKAAFHLVEPNRGVVFYVFDVTGCGSDRFLFFGDATVRCGYLSQ